MIGLTLLSHRQVVPLSTVTVNREKVLGRAFGEHKNLHLFLLHKHGLTLSWSHNLYNVKS